MKRAGLLMSSSLTGKGDLRSKKLRPGISANMALFIGPLICAARILKHGELS
jgi:hypothetical protein